MRKTTLPITLLTGLLILLLTQACKKNTPELKPNPSQNSSRVVDSAQVSLALTYFKDSISEEEDIQAIKALKNLSFEEVKVFNQMRYDSILTLPDVDDADVEYWREWSKQANQLAFNKTGKGYFALSQDEMKAVGEELDVIVIPKEIVTSSPRKASRKARRSYEECSGNGECCPWFRDPKEKLPIALVSPYKLRTYRPTSVGTRNFAGNSPDCDYLFEFTLRRIDRPVGIWISHILTSHAILLAPDVAQKTIYKDDNPGIVCTTYKVQVGIGKDRLDKAFRTNNPYDIKIKLVVERTYRQGFHDCYTDIAGKKTVYSDGSIHPSNESIINGPEGLLGYFPCECEIDGHYYLR